MLILCLHVLTGIVYPGGQQELEISPDGSNGIIDFKSTQFWA